LLLKTAFAASIDYAWPVKLVSGQSRPLRFRLHAQGSISSPRLILNISYTIGECSSRHQSPAICRDLSVRGCYDPHKITFLHPSQIVSYAILRAPSIKICSHFGDKQRLPILLNLHGASVKFQYLSPTLLRSLSSKTRFFSHILRQRLAIRTHARPLSAFLREFKVILTPNSTTEALTRIVIKCVICLTHCPTFMLGFCIRRV